MNIFRVFMLNVALCVSCGALADAGGVEEILADALDKAYPESAVVFKEVDQMDALLNKLNWNSSTDENKKNLHTQLSEIVKEIKELQQMTMEELLQKKVDDAKEAYEEARENERSTANKLLGGASMAAMGIGGMELASALSEKKSMEDAEMQMKAYLATFACDWADGKRVAGGEMAIELPGGNELLSLVGEYKTLAADLKARKEALGLKPGVESEEILDSATANLYDDVATGKTDGAFTSLSRALSDENSEDAAEWAADKEAINQKVKTATTVLAVAAATSIAANLAINGGRERRNQLAEKAKPVTDDVYAVLSEIVNKCNDERIRSGKSSVISWTQLLEEDENICNVQ